MSAPSEAPPPKPDRAASLSDIVENMDARAWRAMALSALLVVGFLALLVVGRVYWGPQITAFIDSTLGQAQRQHWGLAATVLVFVLTSFVGAPQFVLIGACVVAFGPVYGFWYAWIATIASGAVNYLAGVITSAQTTKHFGGATGGRFTRFMSRNAFLASLLIRNVPSAPFIVVNMAFGAARVNFLAFILGLTLGVLPKTALVAFGGASVMAALEGNVVLAVAMVLAAVLVWFLGAFLVRRFIRASDSARSEPPTQ
ncbi:MAG: TVP38/TMEM64 family protein [Proteobacteria bacterium]|nr:TVP38/TMEM64 family protein [Pseudomonadota bacterium]